jgi:mannose-6-phosphate isomerase-like protein (cupin superfamily)
MFKVNIEKATKNNKSYRKVLHTTGSMQLVVMSIPSGGDIPEETHDKTTQFIRVESGSASAIIDGKRRTLKTDDSIIIPPGAKHYIKSIGESDLKLYTIYSPPEHPKHTHVRKQK